MSDWTEILFMGVTAVVCLLAGHAMGWASGRQRGRREVESENKAFPEGWRVGQVGLSPDGNLLEWCGHPDVVARLTQMAVENRRPQ